METHMNSNKNMCRLDHPRRKRGNNIKRVFKVSRIGSIYFYFAIIRLLLKILETWRGRITQGKEKNTHGRDEHLAPGLREQNGHTEWIEDGYGALERRDYN